MLPDFYTYLKNDSTLATLLGGTSADPRIYPDAAPDGKSAPYIVYAVNDDGDTDELLDHQTIDISMYASTPEANFSIAERLKALLDKQDQISISSTNYRIHWCKLVGGNSIYEPDARLYHRVASYAIRYHKKGDQ
jgi:hypothetical protein